MSSTPVVVFNDGISAISALGGKAPHLSSVKTLWLSEPAFQPDKKDLKYGTKAGKLENGIKYSTYLVRQMGWIPGTQEWNSSFAAVIEIELPYLVQHIHAISHDESEEYIDESIESRFENHFTMSVAKNAEALALLNLTSETMRLILEDAPDAIFEYWKNKIRIALPIKHTYNVSGHPDGIFKLEVTQAEYDSRISSVLGIADGLVEASKSAKLENQDYTKYVELDYQKGQRIALFVLFTSIIGITATVGLVIGLGTGLFGG